MLRTIILLVAVLSVVSAYTKEAKADKIASLPGAEGLAIKFNQFSGYLAIPGTSAEKTKHIHYWFVESQNAPAEDPLAFWTNGGPGCSGLIGLMTEHGPFKATSSNALTMNPYSWNTVSNMLYVEQPAGVGFSFIENETDLSIGDAQAALDNYNIIQAFLTRFPEYKTNAFYLSSESYGGHYLPMLSQQIVLGNADPSRLRVNLQGFALGNPYTDFYSGNPAMAETFWGHQLVPKYLYQKYAKNCADYDTFDDEQCNDLTNHLFNHIGNLNYYALDYPVCTSSGGGGRGVRSTQALYQLNHQLRLSGLQARAVGIQSVVEETAYEPCIEDYATAYLDQEEVKVALHVNSSMRWKECSSRVYNGWNLTDMNDVVKEGTVPIFSWLIDGNYGLNLLVYSGDDDSICGTVGSQEWIWGLGYDTVDKAWEEYIYDQQTAGYLTKFKGKLAFLTIHGAGHMVPTTKPEVALQMWKDFLAGKFTSS